MMSRRELLIIDACASVNPPITRDSASYLPTRIHADHELSNTVEMIGAKTQRIAAAVEKI
jgi:hypothetical protein